MVKPAFIAIYYGCRWRGIPSIHTLPNIFTVILSCLANDYIYDIVVYATHRALHNKFLYKHIHKKHHEYRSTIAIANIYSHPVEHLLSNLLPSTLAPMILGSHIATFWICVIAFMISSTIAHSGYHLPFLNSAEFHDFHHVR